MLLNIDGYDLFNEMQAIYPDDFSLEGCKVLDWYYSNEDCSGYPTVNDIAVNWCEFGVETNLTLMDLVNDYGYLYPYDNWANDNDISGKIDVYIDEYLNDLTWYIEQHATVLETRNGYLINE